MNKSDLTHLANLKSEELGKEIAAAANRTNTRKKPPPLTYN
jgi:hypothetical protein